MKSLVDAPWLQGTHKSWHGGSLLPAFSVSDTRRISSPPFPPFKNTIWISWYDRIVSRGDYGLSDVRRQSPWSRASAKIMTQTYLKREGIRMGRAYSQNCGFQEQDGQVATVSTTSSIRLRVMYLSSVSCACGGWFRGIYNKLECSI